MSTSYGFGKSAEARRIVDIESGYVCDRDREETIILIVLGESLCYSYRAYSLSIL
jgi:hypothetical protein